ncbi:MAG: adenylyl-sulfate kinase [Erysipelotrichaceae bacterium]|nr:adenylyl-sulfate kinase [Erysipelotrichaceae bacterium]
MPKIIFISGACGSGKSTFADTLARHLVRQDHKTVYLIELTHRKMGICEEQI